MIKFLLILCLACITPLLAQEYYYNNNEKVNLTPTEDNINASPSRTSTKTTRYFKTPSKHVVGVKDEIIIKTDFIDSVLADYNVTLVSKLSKNLFLLKVKEISKVFNISNALYEDSKVEFAHPNFYKEVQKR
jgi:hypothetical protein